MLAAAMSISLFATVPVSAETGKTTYTYDGYSVEYNVTNEWEGNQTVEITVSNTGDESILNWALKYDAEGEISNLWNANIYEQTESDYVIKNVGWNYEIAPKQSVVYGYTLSGENISVPETFEIYSKRVDVTEGYDVKCNYTQTWDTGVQGELVITNTSDTPIEAWTLSFDTNFTISNLWNGRILENTDTSYVVSSQMWTNPIQANGSTTIGFVGTKTADIEALLNNFKLTAVVVGEGTPIVPIDPPEEKIEITANAEYNEENDNVTVSWITTNPNGIFDILMSSDGENFTSVGTVENVSEFVYTPATDFEAYHFKVVQTVGEQFAESNVVSVVKSVEDIAISAEAVYDEESGNVTVKWTTSNPNGTFDILMSSDGVIFTSVGTVENATEFIYAPTEDFETLYFQVKQTYKNQAAESNVVAVANSAEDIAISADAEYDTENNNVIVEWTSNKENGKFEIFVSEDGESYTSIAVVEDVVEYVYAPENKFEVLYFKVKQTTGLKSAESNIAMVSYDEEEHIDDVLSWDEMVDTDGDGLPDYVEADYETDINNTDTDGDGLSDGYEVLNCGTDPSLYDTDGNGINDGNEDLDSDKLSNLEECKLGTTPIVNDSDHDGLNDGDEVTIYNTQPLVYDSDSDGISDGDEVTKGLNPNNAATFGVPDSEYTFEQSLTADNIVFDLINYDENPFSMSLKVNAAGNAENSISVSKSGYSIIIENECILGCVPEIVYDENLKIDNIEVSFDIAQDYLVDMYSSNKLSGIHKYNIFTYNEDLNMIMPVVTEYDAANNRISTTTDNVGTYFVVDMNKWVEQLGIESASQETNATSTFSINNNVALMSKQNSSVANTEYIDVAFLIYNTQQYSNVVKKQLTTTVEAMYSNYDNIRVFFVVYTGGAYVCGLTGNPYAESVEEAANIINRLSFTPTSTTITTVKGFTAITDLEWRENSQRHMFMIDALIEPMCKFDMPSFTNIADNGINVAICYDAANANASTYKAMTVNTYGNVVGLDRYLIPLITFPEKDDVMLMSTNLLPVELDEEITKGYAEAAEELYYNEEIRNTYVGYADTDKDGLYDFEEINFETELITFENNGKVKLPTFAECLAATKNNKIISAFDVYKDEAFYDGIMEKHILIINSDPLSEDGDGDEILDFDEVAIIKKEIKSNSQTFNTFAVTANKDSDGDGISDKVESKHKGTLDTTRKDTVKSIFTKLAKKNKITLDDSTKHFWITFDPKNENHIIINARINYNEKSFDKNGFLEELSSALTIGEVFDIAEYNTDKKSVNDLYKKISIDTSIKKDKTPIDISNLKSIEDVEDLSQAQINTLSVDFINNYNKKIKKVNMVAKENYEYLSSSFNKSKTKFTKNTSIKTLMLRAIETRWKCNTAEGTEYDFYPGMKISYEVSLKKYDPKIGGKYTDIIFNNNKCGHSNVSTKKDEDNDNIKVMNIYLSQCKYVVSDSKGNKKEHFKLEEQCGYYSNALKSIEVLCGTFAHEFGHVFGLKDAYPKVVKCDLLPQIESNYNTNNTVKNGMINAGEIMRCNGCANLNNVEMILFAKANNTVGYFTPNDKLSPAFKAPIIVYKKENESKENIYYYYEQSSKKTHTIGDFNQYTSWLDNLKKTKSNWYKCII